MPNRTMFARSPMIAVATVVALALCGVFVASRFVPNKYTLTMTAGDAKGQRHKMAMALAELLRRDGVRLEVVPTSGSGKAMTMMASGTLDLALVQGGLGGDGGLTQVASLAVEPLHLLVKPELAGKGLESLRGRVVNLSTAGSGTRLLANEVLAFAGFKAGRDFTDSSLSYSELAALPRAQLPDAVFTVSLLPSPVAQDLATRCGYRLMAIPFSSALALRDYAVRGAVIPGLAYGVTPPIPASDTATVGTNLLLMARADVPDEAVQRVLKAVLDVRFARATGIAPIDESAVANLPELPLHNGTTAFLQRNNPAITFNVVQSLDSFRNLIVSFGIAVFFGWRWWRRRNLATFDGYFDAVTKLERDTLGIEADDSGRTTAGLIALRRRLGEIKADALNEFTEGRLSGEEMMSGFLTHVADARSHLDALILHERYSEARDSGTLAVGTNNDDNNTNIKHKQPRRAIRARGRGAKRRANDAGAGTAARNAPVFDPPRPE